MKFRISLNGHWTLRYGKQTGPTAPTLEEARALETTELEARIPGNVELDLQQAGVVPPLERENHVFEMQEFEDCFWWFERPLTVPRFSPQETVELMLDGVDCLATIYIDDTEVAWLDNMLIPWRLSIGDYLQPGRAHRLSIVIGSAVLAARDRIPAPGERAGTGKWESLAIRKAPHMYGWDILPRLVGAGIWRDAALEIRGPTRWRSVYVATPEVDAVSGRSTLWIDWDLQTELHDLDELRIRVILQRHGHVWFDRTYPVYETHGRITETLEQVKIWWPRGYGEPALHDLRCAILNPRGRPLDEFHARVGFRTVTLDQSHGAFTLLVNDQPVFCRGPVWTALDALHSRDPHHAHATLDLLRELNCTMVRCWGGNVYADDAFFDFCDQHGILVWQDFAFAGAAYPQDASFLEAVRQEVTTIARRLRNHPSLALWYGGNESDSAPPSRRQDGSGRVVDSTTRSVIQETVTHLDLYRPYLDAPPPSPSDGAELRRVGTPSGDFRACFPAGHERPFVHEIGAHGCPARETLEAMFADAHLWPWQDNEQWYARAVRSRPDDSAPDYRIHHMSRQIEFLFGRVPDELDDFILASQIAQAEALKFFIEWARQRAPAVSGLLWWHLRDGWPVLSEAVVDYYHRRKLAWAFIQRAQADLCVILGQPRDQGHPVVVVNDSLQTQSGHLVIRGGGRPEPVFEADYHVPANAIVTVGHLREAAQWDIHWTAGQDATGSNHGCGLPPPFDLRAYARWLQDIGYPLSLPTAAGAPR